MCNRKNRAQHTAAKGLLFPTFWPRSSRPGRKQSYVSVIILSGKVCSFESLSSIVFLLVYTWIFNPLNPNHRMLKQFFECQGKCPQWFFPQEWARDKLVPVHSRTRPLCRILSLAACLGFACRFCFELGLFLKFLINFQIFFLVVPLKTQTFEWAFCTSVRRCQAITAHLPFHSWKRSAVFCTLDMAVELSVSGGGRWGGPLRCFFVSSSFCCWFLFPRRS